MNIIISHTSDKPMYEQIEDGIKKAIYEGELKNNEMLPSVRQLAKDLNVDLNPRIILGRPCVGEERGNHAVVLDRLHGSLIVAVMVMVTGSLLCAGVIVLAGCVLVD